jgi:soluble lytic murein transglycosylase-like protein
MQQMPQQMPPEMPQQMEDTGVAQLPIPDREYAGGGIIAFADGGLSDETDDYEDALEEADYEAMIERAMNAGEDEYTPTFETRQAKGSPQSFPNSERGIASIRPESRAAKGDDLESRLRSVILQKESGGRRYDKSGNLLTSSKGAQGEMQVMPATARDPGYGIRPAQNNSPDELKRVGDEYAGVLLRRYKDPILAMIAYNMGPGATDKWLAAGADPRKLPKETQGYISGVNLAGGGAVQHFTKGGSTEFEEDLDYFGNYLKRKKEMLGESFEELNPIPSMVNYFKKPISKDADAQPGGFYGGTASKPASTPSKPSESSVTEGAGFTPDEMIAGSSRAGTFEAMNKDTTSGISVDDLRKAQTKEAPKSRLDEYMEELMASRADLKKQKTQDANLALLAAGLGMMGGSSRYAAENIGKGALAGVQNFSESSKQRGAEKAALDKSMLYATRYQGAEDLAKQNAAYNRAMKERQYGLDVKKQGTEEQKIAINQYETHINNAIRSLDKNPLLTADPVARAAAEEKIINSPQAIALRRRAYGNMEMESPSFAGFSAVERKK